jgi:hypothetical protein
MKNTKLFILLSTLEDQQWEKLETFLTSGLFSSNNNSKSPILLQFLHPYFHGQHDTLPEKEAIWNALYPNDPFQDLKLRRVFSDLTQQILEFLGISAALSHPTLLPTYTLSAINSPALEKHFNGVLRQMESIEQGEDLLNPTTLFLRQQVAQTQHQRREMRSRRSKAFPELESADYWLDAYYYTQKLKNLCDALGYQKTLAGQVAIHLPNQFLEELPAQPAFREMSVQAYYLAAQMLLHPEEEHFFKQLKTQLEEKGKQFAVQERKTLFTHLINYCIDTKINHGQTHYYEQLFDLYRIALAQSILLDKQYLNPQHYRNIITVGLVVEAYSWVEQFIQEHTDQLPPVHRANAATYNLAKVYFHRKQYENVIELLREVEYENVTYALGGKLMLLKTYYELDELTPLDSLLDSFRIYLRRNQLISREIKQQYLNVLRIVKRMAQVAPYDRKAIEKLRNQVDKSNSLADKNWILAKLKELEGK